MLGPTALVGKGGDHAIDGGNWVRNYSWQRYTSIGAGATEIQKNIIAKKALKLVEKR
jgi:alkylation response protein AidB-like acyl-CoA dehydrogenase